MKNKNEEIEQFIEEFGEKLRWKKLDHSNVVQVVTEMLKHKMVKEDWIKDGTQKLEREYSQGLKDNEYAAEF
jgi:DNA-binding PadR family transcriptional regulator